MRKELESGKTWTSSFLSSQIMDFVTFKRAFIFHESVYKRGRKKVVLNDVLYTQYKLAFDGFVVCFHNYGVVVLRQLRGRLKSSHRKDISLSSLLEKAAESGNRPVMVHFGIGDQDAAEFKRAKVHAHQESIRSRFKKLFPNAVKRESDFPLEIDIDKLCERFEKIVRPLKDHRDTCSAHWDKRKKRKPISAPKMRRVVKDVERFLGDLLLVSDYASHSFDIGGYASDPEHAAIKFLEILSAR